MNDVKRWAILIGSTVTIFVLVGLAWMVGHGYLYTAGSDLGYYMGLVGGLLMLSLLVYPLRKRLKWMDRMGSMPSWFNYHMIVGIGGPLLVVYHSTFRTGSMNGAVVLYTTLIVAISGVIGRFVYRHVHQGLYGEMISIEGTEQELKASTEAVQAEFAYFPDVLSDLEAFRQSAMNPPASKIQKAWKFMILRNEGYRLADKLATKMKSSIRKALKKKETTRADGKKNYLAAKRLIISYVDAVCNAAHLRTWEYLFSMWHYLHIPFIYLLVISGIVHVVAVHLY